MFCIHFTYICSGYTATIKYMTSTAFWHQNSNQHILLHMQAIKEAGERGKDELHARMLLYLSPSAARAQDPSFIQVCLWQRCATRHCIR